MQEDDIENLDPKLLAAAQALDNEDQNQDDEETQDESEELESTEESTDETESQEDEEEVIEDEFPPEVTQTAKKNGHLSKPEYKKKYGSLDGYKDPEKFNKFGELYPEIKDALKGMSKKLEKSEQELKVTMDYLEQVRQNERLKARQDILNALEEAKVMGDMNAIQHYTKEETKLDFQDAQEASKKAASQIQSAVSDFETRNADWYNKDQEMTARAAELDVEVRQGKYSHIMSLPTNYEQLFNQVELLVKNEFKDRMQTRSAAASRSAPALSNSSSSMAKTAGLGSIDAQFNKLSKEHKMLYDIASRCAKGYTKEDHIKNLKRDGSIK